MFDKSNGLIVMQHLHAFRSATLEALFVRELQLRTDEGTSYRFLIRSLTSEMPLLQLVVLNYDSSLSTGSITACACETDCDDDFLSNRSKVFPEEIESSVNLQRVMKVMFSDCSRFSTDERRYEHWLIYDAALDSYYGKKVQV
mgnify:CR=1 FL=1